MSKISVREQVEHVLSNHVATRNSDWSFIFQLLKENGVKIPSYIRKQIYSSNINIRTVMREKQFVQNTKGLYPPTNPSIIANKKKREKQFKDSYANGEVPSEFN